MGSHRLLRSLASTVAISLVGCQPTPDVEEVGVAAAPIVGGDPIGVLESTGVARVSTSHGFCSGTILTNRWVLTAAHCFSDADLGSPSTVWAQYGSTGAPADGVLVHPAGHVGTSDGTDVALVRLASPLVIDGATSGYEMGIYGGGDWDIVGRPLACLGYGRTDDDDPSTAGTLHKAILTPRTVDDGLYQFERNSLHQITAHGDSGGPCFVEEHGGRSVATVDSTFTDVWGVIPAADYASEVAPSQFREWVLQTIGGGPYDLSAGWPSPMPNDYWSSRIWDPCAGGCFTWSADYSLEYGYDYLTVGSSVLTGTGTASGSACGAAFVSLASDYSVTSAGVSRLEAACTTPHVDCHGTSCRANLPAGVSSSAPWDPCHGFCYRWGVEYALLEGSITVGTTGLPPGAPGFNGYACGPTNVAATAGTPLEMRLDALCDDVEYMPVSGAVTDDIGVALGLLDNNTTPDLLRAAYDDPEGANEFRVFAFMNLDRGNATSYAEGVFPGLGFDGEGAGIALGQIGRGRNPDLLVMAVDASEGANEFRYQVHFDLTVSGGTIAASGGVWASAGPVVGAGSVGEVTQGGGVALGDLNYNGRLDLVVGAFDASHEHRYRVLFDLDPTTGVFTSELPGYFAAPNGPRVGEGSAEGAGLTLVRRGRQTDLVLLTYSRWEGGESNQFRIAIGTNFMGGSPALGLATAWRYASAPGMGWRGAGADIAYGDVGVGRPMFVVAGHDDAEWGDETRIRYVDPAHLD